MILNIPTPTNAGEQDGPLDVDLSFVAKLDDDDWAAVHDVATQGHEKSPAALRHLESRIEGASPFAIEVLARLCVVFVKHVGANLDEEQEAAIDRIERGAPAEGDLDLLDDLLLASEETRTSSVRGVGRRRRSVALTPLGRATLRYLRR